MTGTRFLIVEEVAADADRTGRNDLVIQEQTEGGISAETQLCFDNFAVKGEILLEFRNGVVSVGLVAGNCEIRGLVVGILFAGKPYPFLYGCHEADYHLSEFQELLIVYLCSR
jgi:hypothetical protein